MQSPTASILAWAQTRRFDELGESYSLAAHELRAIRQGIAAAPDEAVFVELIVEREGAISREHTMWVARRLPQNVARPLNLIVADREADPDGQRLLQG